MSFFPPTPPASSPPQQDQNIDVEEALPTLGDRCDAMVKQLNTHLVPRNKYDALIIGGFTGIDGRMDQETFNRWADQRLEVELRYCPGMTRESYLAQMNAMMQSLPPLLLGVGFLVQRLGSNELIRV